MAHVAKHAIKRAARVATGGMDLSSCKADGVAVIVESPGGSGAGYLSGASFGGRAPCRTAPATGI